MLKLRPHHINCLFFYRGMGYSKDFVERINQISIKLKDKPNTRVILVDACDNICEKCPNRDEENCVTEDKVSMLDNETLLEYGLQINKEYNFNKVVKKIYKNFSGEKLEKICKTCEWYKKGICSKEAIEEQKNLWNIDMKG